MSRIPDGLHRLDLSPSKMLAAMSKRTGGIPDFAKEALEKMGVDKADIDAADKEGRK